LAADAVAPASDAALERTARQKEKGEKGAGGEAFAGDGSLSGREGSGDPIADPHLPSRYTPTPKQRWPKGSTDLSGGALEQLAGCARRAAGHGETLVLAVEELAVVVNLSVKLDAGKAWRRWWGGAVRRAIVNWLVVKAMASCTAPLLLLQCFPWCHGGRTPFPLPLVKQVLVELILLAELGVDAANGLVCKWKRGHGASLPAPAHTQGTKQGGCVFDRDLNLPLVLTVLAFSACTRSSVFSRDVTRSLYELSWRVHGA